jgi:hypothetical protein
MNLGIAGMTQNRSKFIFADSTDALDLETQPEVEQVPAAKVAQPSGSETART